MPYSSFVVHCIFYISSTLASSCRYATPEFLPMQPENPVFDGVVPIPLSVAVSVPDMSKPLDNSCQDLDRLGNVYIISDNGLYLSKCLDCGFRESTKLSSEPETFRFEPHNGQCAIRVGNNYVSRCNRCLSYATNAGTPDTVFTHGEKVTPPALWVVTKVGNQFAFKGDTGKYMARCRDCFKGSKYPDHAFIHGDSPIGAALWSVKPA